MARTRAFHLPDDKNEGGPLTWMEQGELTCGKLTPSRKTKLWRKIRMIFRIFAIILWIPRMVITCTYKT